MEERDEVAITFDARLAFEELPLEGRMAVIDDLLADLDADQVRAAVADPQCIGIVAEALLVGLRDSEDLLRYIQRSDIARLGELIKETLLARLPNLGEHGGRN